MGNNYVLSLQPTFTQGLILGQLSIIVLLVLILKYLFLDSTEYPFETSSYHPRVDSDPSLKDRKIPSRASEEPDYDKDAESAEWFNALLQQIVEVYRYKLRDDLSGAEGDEIARKRIEDYANTIRPPGFLDHISIHSVDLGVSAPCLTKARIKRQEIYNLISETELDLYYTDTLSISLSTSYLFNYPMPSFARLPLSLTISLSLFKSSARNLIILNLSRLTTSNIQIIITPPSPASTSTTLKFSISPNFTLDLTTTSLMGSRAKLANVPKLHELIQHQLRRSLATHATWKVDLPGLSTMVDATKEGEMEMTQGSNDMPGMNIVAA